jgi:hypothetical protein
MIRRFLFAMGVSAATFDAASRIGYDDDETVRQAAGVALRRIDPNWKPPADVK